MFAWSFPVARLQCLELTESSTVVYLHVFGQSARQGFCATNVRHLHQEGRVEHEPDTPKFVVAWSWRSCIATRLARCGSDLRSAPTVARGSDQYRCRNPHRWWVVVLFEPDDVGSARSKNRVRDRRARGGRTTSTTTPSGSWLDADSVAAIGADTFARALSPNPKAHRGRMGSSRRYPHVLDSLECDPRCAHCESERDAVGGLYVDAGTSVWRKRARPDSRDALSIRDSSRQRGGVRLGRTQGISCRFQRGISERHADLELVFGTLWSSPVA